MKDLSLSLAQAAAAAWPGHSTDHFLSLSPLFRFRGPRILPGGNALDLELYGEVCLRT